MQKITLIGMCMILLIVAGCEYPRKDSIYCSDCLEQCIDSDIYTLYSELVGLNNMTCFEIGDYHNKIVDRCMDIAQENMEEGYYNHAIYNRCYSPDLKSHILMLMDKQCEAKGR